MIERELKFRVNTQYELPTLAGVSEGVATADDPARMTLTAVYVDTPDLRLARSGVTLRRREGGDDDGWHLKLPTAVVSERHEIQVLSDAREVPEELRSLVTAFVRFAPLRDVATITADRTVHLLRDEAGEPAIEVVDDTVSVLNGSHVAARFREIEIEDKGAGEQVLGRVADTLAGSGAVGGEFVPKVVRALGPAATAEPDPPPPAKVGPDDPAQFAVEAVFRRYIRAFITNDPRVRRHEPDAVHQMRVAARRLRSALRTFAPLLQPGAVAEVSAELKWIADELGAARDGEVMLERLNREIDALPAEIVMGPVRARIEQSVGADLVKARAEVSDVLETERYVRLVDRLVDLGWSPPTTSAALAPARTLLPGLVNAAWDGLARRARRLKRADATEEAYHRTRIAAKRARYAAEAVAPVFGKPARALAEQVESVQEVLGEHQDAVVTRDLLYNLARAPRAGSVGFTLGLLYERQRAAAVADRARFHSLWPDVSHRRYRRWLDSV